MYVIIVDLNIIKKIIDKLESNLKIKNRLSNGSKRV